MSGLTDFLQQLSQRRVIRAGVLYAAGVWLILQVADLLAQAGMVSDDFVRWMILLALIFFPITLALTWFFEHPWHGRPWLAMAGDIAMLLIVSLAAGLLAYQQWTKSFTRPVVAVLNLEPTDAQPGTGDLANHLASRFRLFLATMPELQVLELSSSQHPSLAVLPVTEKAKLLHADYLLAGTVNQSRQNLRASIQLFDADGNLLWSDRFSDRVINQQQMQYSIMAAAWPAIGLDESALLRVRELIRGCSYPANQDAVKAIATLEGRLGGRETHSLQDYERMVSELDALIGGTEEKGLLYLLRARSRWQALNLSPPLKRTVMQRLLMKDLEDAAYLCPTHPDAKLYRLQYTRALERQDADVVDLLERYPNEASIRKSLARSASDNGDTATAIDLARQAFELDPLAADMYCFYQQLARTGEDSAWQEQLAIVSGNAGGTNDCQP